MENIDRLEAACALAFRDSMRAQGTNIREASASQYSIAFHAAAEAVVGKIRSTRDEPE